MQGELDTATGGTGLAGFSALAQHSPDLDDEDGPFRVHGIALGSGDTTNGVSGKAVYWPDDVLEAAAESLIGKKIVSDRDHDDFDRRQPDPKTIIGEVTAASFRPGVGVAYDGELDDPDIAKQVKRGRVDVSPMLWRRTGEFDQALDDGNGAYPAEEVVAWRDLAVVSQGASEGASIRPGAASALAAEALRSAFVEGDSAGEGTDAGTDGSTADADDPNGDERAESRADGSEPSGSDTDTDPTMDLTDDEESLVHAARSTDDPVVVPASTKALADDANELALTDFDEPTIVESDEFDHMNSRVSLIDDLLTDQLVEGGETKASEAAAMSFSEKFERFENDDGEFEAEALVQSPEAGGANDPGDPGGSGGSGGSSGTDDLTDDDRSEINSLSKRAETFDGVDDDLAESLRSEAADIAGVDDYDDIEAEVL